MYSSLSIHNHQILQRDLVTNSVTVTLTNDTTIELPVGGPYRIESTTDVYVGDIWIMAGQSNMRGHGYLSPHLSPTTPGAHLYDSTETWRLMSDPTHCLAKSKRAVHHTLPDPTVKNPQICQYRGASLGPSFGASYHMPVGLVASAHGGVSLDDWRRPDAMNDETADITLYGAMMDRIKSIGDIAGILWYQGESDTDSLLKAESYKDRLLGWIMDVRKDLAKPLLPVVIVQLGQHRLDAPGVDAHWMTVQKQQYEIANTDDYIAVVASRDCGLDDRVHLSRDGLHILGKRVAKAAKLAIEGRARESTPLLKTAVCEKKVHIERLVEIYSMKLEFDLPDGYQFHTHGADVVGFELQGVKAVILRAVIEPCGRAIRLFLSNELTETDVTICYGMNQQAINLNSGQNSILPVFKKHILLK